jgi:hypothetical protein
VQCNFPGKLGRDKAAGDIDTPGYLANRIGQVRIEDGEKPEVIQLEAAVPGERRCLVEDISNLEFACHSIFAVRR